MLWDTPDTAAFPTLDPLNNHSMDWMDAGSCWDATIGSALDWMCGTAGAIGDALLGDCDCDPWDGLF